MTMNKPHRAYRLAAVGLAIAAAQGCATTPPPPQAAKFGGETMRADTRYFQTRLGKLAVHIAGDSGPYVVLWPAVFSDSSIYRAQVSALRASYRLVLIDGPGFGASEAPREPFTMQACADAVADVLRDLKVPRASFVGTSWGGIVGVHFALRHPQQIERLVLMNTPFETPANGPEFSDRMVVWSARWVGATDLFANGVARSYFPKNWRDSHVQELAAFAASFKGLDTQGMAIAARSVLLERASLTPMLPQIKAPTLVVAGSNDPLYPAPTLQAAANRIPGARFAEVPDSGHISAVDQPGLVTSLLEDFLGQP